MKKKLFVFYLSLITLAFFSCTKETTESTAEELGYDDLGLPIEGYTSKIVAVSDESGENIASVKFYAETEELLEKHLENWEYSIEAVFEESETETNTIEEDGEEVGDEANFNTNDIVTEFLDVDLVDDATGFVLKVSFVGLELKSGYETGTWHPAPKYWHHAKVVWKESYNSDQGIKAEFWTQYKWISDWRKKETDYLSSSNPSAEFYYSHYRIRVKVWHNYGNYDVYFKHWESDGWSLDD